jgi:hypothetical protein
LDETSLFVEHPRVSRRRVVKTDQESGCGAQPVDGKALLENQDNVAVKNSTRAEI